MKKTYKFFVVSDIHGEMRALEDALHEAGYDANNPQHFFVCLGDSFDRGKNSRDIYNFFIRLPKDRSMFVKGNHDCFLQEFLEKGMDGEFVLFNILHNGLGATIGSLGYMDLTDRIPVESLDDAARYIRGEYPNLLSFIKNMPLWFETDHTIMVHAGLNPKLPDWKLTDEHYALWDIADAHKMVPSTRKTIIFGHYHADQVAEQARNEGMPVFDIKDHPSIGRDKVLHYEAYGNRDEFGCKIIPNSYKIAIDGCTNLTEKVNVLVFEDTITTPDEDNDDGINAKPVDIITKAVEEGLVDDRIEGLVSAQHTPEDIFERNINWAQYTTTAGDIDGAAANHLYGVDDLTDWNLHTTITGDMNGVTLTTQPYMTVHTHVNADGTVWMTTNNQ